MLSHPVDVLTIDEDPARQLALGPPGRSPWDIQGVCSSTRWLTRSSAHLTLWSRQEAKDVRLRTKERSIERTHDAAPETLALVLEYQHR